MSQYELDFFRASMGNVRYGLWEIYNLATENNYPLVKCSFIQHDD